MIELTLEDVAAATGGIARGSATVTGVAIDSRRTRPGDLFVALPGERTHGARHAAAARSAGAAAVLARPGETLEPGPGVSVADPVVALGAVAAEVRRRSHARVIAVTGSTGKTSTKDILAALLRRRFRTVASRANENNEIGLPLTLCGIDADTQVVVCELAMRGAGQIAYLARIARPDAAVITSVGPVHLELLGTVEAVAAAKAEVLAELGPDGVAVVPHGEPLLAPHMRGFPGRVVTFGDAEGADVRVVEVAAGRVVIARGRRNLPVPVNFTQHHNGINLAAAVAVCDALGLNEGDALVAGGVEVEFSALRGEEIPLSGGGLLMADCYNANPASMDAALRHLARTAAGRRTVAVMGDMAELGPTASEWHARVGETARELGIDRVVAVGPLARGYGGDWYANVADVVADIGSLVAPGDVVLVKASRSMGLEALVEAVTG
jgi:UDP-N-acetylmuramoyl-tripeptide--D-alanyl-D-alanine ligase